MKHQIPQMVTQGGGAIVNIGSVLSNSAIKRAVDHGLSIGRYSDDWQTYGTQWGDQFLLR